MEPSSGTLASLSELALEFAVSGLEIRKGIVILARSLVPWVDTEHLMESGSVSVAEEISLLRWGIFTSETESVMSLR